MSITINLYAAGLPLGVLIYNPAAGTIRSTDRPDDYKVPDIRNATVAQLIKFALSYSAMQNFRNIPGQFCAHLHGSHGVPFGQHYILAEFLKPLAERAVATINVIGITQKCTVIFEGAIKKGAEEMDVRVTDKAVIFREKAQTCPSEDINKLDMFIGGLPLNDNDYLQFIAQCPKFLITWKPRRR